MNGIEVPLELCRECGQCCHFITPRHLSPFASRDTAHLPAELLSRSGSPSLVPDSKEGIPVWTCSLFDRPSGRCLDHPDHPLDCRIYPLVLYFDDRARIGLDLSCPFTSKKPRIWFLEKADELAHTFWSKLSNQEREILLPLLKEDAGPSVDPLVDLAPGP
jgi:Fe-S-cluster containining protein